MSQRDELVELKRNWRAPVELAGSGPRDVELSGHGRVLAVLVAAIFLGAIAAAVGLSRISARDAQKIQTLREQGVQVPGVVTRHWRTGDKDHRPMVDYTFEVADRTYHGSASAPREVWEALLVGSPLAVRFVPSRPEWNHPADWEGESLPPWVAGFVAAMLAGAGSLLTFLLRRQMRLLAEGRPAPARVTTHVRVKHGKAMKYEFLTLSGEVAKGRGGESRKPPAIGAVITVLYDRDNPRRNAPYPLEFTRIAR